MTLRLTDLIDNHEDFIDPDSANHILSTFKEKQESEEGRSEWNIQETDFVTRGTLRGASAVAVAMTLQNNVSSILRDFYNHNTIMSNEAFPASLMCQIDRYNITIHHVKSGKTFPHSVCSANHPAFFHYQLTGRIILFNPERRRMKFFFDPNIHSESLPVGSLSIHPSNMLYPHRPDEREGDLIYLEFHLCPPLKNKEEKEEP